MLTLCEWTHLYFSCKVLVFLFYASGGAKGTGGQVQGTALCFRGYPCWGNVFKIYYPHS